jgi:hypothetical protein
MRKHINSKTLNLRSEPLIKPGNILASLPFGHPVEVTGDAAKPGWKTATTTYKGINHAGVISGAFLRDPLSDKKEKLLAAGAVEWDRFERGAGKEADAPFFKFVGEMWQAISENLDGKDSSVPWSAACISFIVRKAGYAAFTFASAHSVYIHEAIKAREGNDGAKDYWGFRLSEHKPTFGDLVCRKRSSANITYDFARTHADFQSHTDIVVATGDGFVDAVGGNVSNSVSITRYRLDGVGFLDADGGRVFAVLKNRR